MERTSHFEKQCLRGLDYKIPLSSMTSDHTKTFEVLPNEMLEKVILYDPFVEDELSLNLILLQTIYFSRIKKDFRILFFLDFDFN